MFFIPTKHMENGVRDRFNPSTFLLSSFVFTIEFRLSPFIVVERLPCLGLSVLLPSSPSMWLVTTHPMPPPFST
jgi:hypothetical protein